MTMYIRKLIFQSFLFYNLLCVNSVFAEAFEHSSKSIMDLELEELVLVTIATGRKQSVAQAPAITTVITAQDISRMGAIELDEVLETVPGLHIARSYINYNPIYTIRGIYSDFNPQILFMINGIPINTLQDGNRGIGWGGMPIHAIEKIEIIRGPGSAVYGADAFSGVINIITKDANNIKGIEAGMRMGSFNTKDLWLLQGHTWQDWNIAFTLEARDTNGYDGIIQEDIQTSYDRIFNTQASFSPDSLSLQKRTLDSHLNIAKGNWRFRTAYQGRYDMGTGAGHARALDNNIPQEERRTLLDLTYHNAQFADNWDATATIAHFNSRVWLNDLMLYPPGAFGGDFPNGSRVNASALENQTYLNLSAFYTGFDKHTIRFGTGYYYADIYEVTFMTNTNPTTGVEIESGESFTDFSDTPDAFLPEKDRKNWHLFVQDSWQFAENWELTSGLRYDNYSDFGSTLNPRLSLVWETTPALTTKLLYGHAFRAPAFSELYTLNNPSAQGNPDLKPETNETWELAFSYQASKTLHLGLNLFHYKWHDAILIEPDLNAIINNPNAGTFQNSGSQRGHGFEFEANWRLRKNLSLLGNYAFQKSMDTDNNNVDAGNIPHHQLYAGLDWQFEPKWHVNTQWHWISERSRSFGDPRSPLEGYSTIDITLQREEFKNHWGFALGVRNLFNQDAREPSDGPDSDGIIGIPYDLPLPDRNYFLEIRYHF